MVELLWLYYVIDDIQTTVKLILLITSIVLFLTIAENDTL